MKKGKAQIEQDIYDALTGFFTGTIGGTLYMSDTRPRDSATEDAVIVAGAPSGQQWQRGRVRIWVFVQDSDNGTGSPVKDTDRVQQIEAMAEPIIDTLHEALPEYSFELFTAPDDGQIDDTAEHFVNIHLQYTRQTF